jgi:hypothetical protein
MTPRLRSVHPESTAFTVAAYLAWPRNCAAQSAPFADPDGHSQK